MTFKNCESLRCTPESYIFKTLRVFMDAIAKEWSFISSVGVWRPLFSSQITSQVKNKTKG